MPDNNLLITKHKSKCASHTLFTETVNTIAMLTDIHQRTTLKWNINQKLNDAHMQRCIAGDDHFAYVLISLFATKLCLPIGECQMKYLARCSFSTYWKYIAKRSDNKQWAMNVNYRSHFAKHSSWNFSTEIRAIKRGTNDEKQCRNQTRSKKVKKEELTWHWRWNTERVRELGWLVSMVRGPRYVITNWILQHSMTNNEAYDVCLLVPASNKPKCYR